MWRAGEGGKGEGGGGWTSTLGGGGEVDRLLFVPHLPRPSPARRIRLAHIIHTHIHHTQGIVSTNTAPTRNRRRGGGYTRRVRVRAPRRARATRTWAPTTRSDHHPRVPPQPNPRPRARTSLPRLPRPPCCAAHLLHHVLAELEPNVEEPQLLPVRRPRPLLLRQAASPTQESALVQP